MVSSSIIYLGFPQQVRLTHIFPRMNCLLTFKGKNQNPESIMIKIDTTLIHLRATLIEALRDPHTVEEDGKGEDKKLSSQ